MKAKNLIVLLLSLFLSGLNLLVAAPAILPHPNHIELKKGMMRFEKELSVSFPSKLTLEGKALISWLDEKTPLKIHRIKKEKEADIILKLEKNNHFQTEEGYSLVAEDGKIIISSYDCKGIFYGIQTLKQLIHSVDETITIPNVYIKDEPRFAWRGLMLDEARNFKGKEAVKKLLDEMAALKLNVFHWHLTNDQGWRIEIKKYPRLTSVGSYRS